MHFRLPTRATPPASALTTRRAPTAAAIGVIRVGQASSRSLPHSSPAGLAAAASSAPCRVMCRRPAGRRPCCSTERRSWTPPLSRHLRRRLHLPNSSRRPPPWPTATSGASCRRSAGGCARRSRRRSSCSTRCPPSETGPGRRSSRLPPTRPKGPRRTEMMSALGPARVPSSASSRTTLHRPRVTRMLVTISPSNRHHPCRAFA